MATEESIKSLIQRFLWGEDVRQPPQEPIERHREPKPDELGLGWAWGVDERENREVRQFKGIQQAHRDAHFYVIGGSGVGKTKFLESLIRQDIKNRVGFGVIDPHGDLIEDIKGYLWLSGLDEKFLQERVVLVDPTDPAETATFNPLERTKNVSPAEQAGELVGVFKKIWHDAWGARMEDLLRNTIIALAENDLTLIELPLFLADAKFRERVLEKVEHPICQQYFKRFNSLRPHTRDEWSESTLNKANAFLSDDRVRYIFAATKSSFNLRDVMDGKKILLIKLDRGRLKEAGDLLGSLLLAKIQMAAFSRGDLSQSKRLPFYLYIDEFQNFATESFVETLAEARKYRLSLVLAHQNLAQLPKALQESILTNCGIQAYFRISRSDAGVLAKESLSPIYTQPPGWETYIQYLQELPPQACVVKNKIEGGVMMIRTADTPPPHQAIGVKEKDFNKLIADIHIGARYLRSRGVVEDDFQERHKRFTEDEESEEPETFREPKSASLQKSLNKNPD